LANVVERSFMAEQELEAKSSENIEKKGHKEKKTRRKHKGLGLVIVLLCVIVINELIKFCFEPYGTASQVMWSDYHKEKELDQIFVGSSLCYVGINPYIIDDMMGTKSYNMGTPAQRLAQSEVAIKTAIEDHHIKRVVMALGYFSLTGERSTAASVAFLRAKDKSGSPIDKVKTYLDYATDDDVIGSSASINYFFPWIYNSVSWGKLSSNIKAKIEGKQAIEQEMVNNVFRHYVGKGYGYLTGNLNFDDSGNKTSTKYYSNTFSDESLQELRDIALLCAENDVELVVVGTPKPAYDILSYGNNGDDYFEKMVLIKELLKECDAKYYDFNLAKEDLFTNNDKYYFDHEHLNKEGSEAFTRSLANLLLKLDAGENVDDYFKSPEEYLNDIDYISAVWFNTKNMENGISVTPITYTGPNVSVEYEYRVYNEDTGAYDLVQDYSTATSCLIPYTNKDSESGQIKIMVNARQIGSDKDYEKRCIQTITYDKKELASETSNE